MSWLNQHVPRKRRSDPSKDSPHLQPHHVTVAVAFLSFCVLGRLRSNSNPLPGSNLLAFIAGAATSRRCSAGESVTSSRRCRRFDALSSLGLCSSSRSFKRPSVRTDECFEQPVSCKQDLRCSTPLRTHPEPLDEPLATRTNGVTTMGRSLIRYLEHDIRRHRAEFLRPKP